MTTDPLINEFLFNPSLAGDPNEFIEIKGDPSTDYSGYSLLVIDGDGSQAGIVDNIFTLGTTNADGYWVTPFQTNKLQNGTQTVLLVRNLDPAVKVGTDLDAGNTGSLTSTPWTGIVDSIAVRDSDASDPTYAGAPVLTGASILGASRVPDGRDTNTAADWVPNDPGEAGIGNSNPPASGTVSNTPGAPNAGGNAATPVTVSIQALNGDSYSSPYSNQQVSTTGIVTAIDSTGTIGYWIQQATKDPSHVGSSAIFVYVGSAAALPTVGSTVTVTGKMTMYTPSSQSNVLATPEINQTAAPVVVGSGTATIAPTLIGAGGLSVPTADYTGSSTNLNASTATLSPTTNALDFYRSLQGQLITLHDVKVVGSTASGATWVVPDGGAGLLNSRGALIQTATNDYTQRIEIYFDSGTSPGTSPFATLGDSLGDVSGILQYYNGIYELVPTTAITVTHDAPAQQVTSFAKDPTHLLLADYNVENLNITTSANLARIQQLAGIITGNLNSPDILALQEIQDNNGTVDDGTVDASQTLQAVVDAIKAAGGPTYAWAQIDPVNDTGGGVAGGNIRNVFLYDTSRVSLVSLDQIGVDQSGTVFKNTRLPLVGTFSFNGQQITLVNVHNSSQAGSSGEYGSVQPPINHGGDTSVVNNRVAQAQTISDYVKGLTDADPGAKIAVLGDFNDVDWSPAQQVYATSGGLTDLNLKEAADNRYTYVFNGNAESLDHTLATGSLYDASQFTTVHVNAEYNDSTRESDHDPSLTLVELTCFLEGTRILTPSGEVAVETLRAGDLVLTASGAARPVRWMGRRDVDLARAAEPDTLHPVRIRRDAFSPNVPSRDLLVTPEHCIAVADGLIPARMLVNGGSIRAERGMRRFRVFHVELDSHDILLADNLPCESYLDTGNRASFDDAPAIALHPRFDGTQATATWAAHASAPLLTAREAVEPVWRDLAARSEALGYGAAPATRRHADPDLRLALEDGTPLAASLRGGILVATLPAGTEAVRLRSRAASRAELDGPFVDDRRRLGVAFADATWGDGHDMVPLDLSDPAVADVGWHAPESTGELTWRWTNGDARLVLPARSRSTRLRLTVHAVGEYLAAEPARPCPTRSTEGLAA
ncbi:Hint domain-containing protein [Rhizosaccharibacter radicis]|uniref:Hint domain-containing protein n=1 Tax=Rhizosaccharibacter radicis TaxID=2782605 RepID=A0ABT1VV50_9PROT|nr:Hint domain-containing protein [Acetobacteraceae bacterium KSS12]